MYGGREDNHMKLAEMNVTDFTQLLASDAPAPGGGSTAALEGALGAALTAMVCRLTAGKEQYAAFHRLAVEVQDKAEALRLEFLTAMDGDTEAFLQVSQAFALPKATAEEKAARSVAIQAGLIRCTETPLQVMSLAAEGLKLVQSLLGKYNENAASDLGTAAHSFRACAHGAWLNVVINVGSLKDKEKARSYQEKGAALLKETAAMADQIHQAILLSLV